MFVFNMKLDGNHASKIFIGVLCVIILLITIFICYHLVSNSFFRTNDSFASNENVVYELSAQNYTNVLKNVHENIDSYIGQKIKFTGYVYRLYDFSDEQFVLARNMIVTSDFQTVVVGFLCHSDYASNFKNDDWVEITGTITKGDYYGEIPIIEIENMNKVDTPTQDEYVYPPDSSFIATSTVL